MASFFEKLKLVAVMLKIFDVICQLADDFYEKKNIFSHISVGFYHSKLVRRLFTIVLNNMKAAVFRQQFKYFSTEQIKLKTPYMLSILCLIFFGHGLLYE